MKLDIVVPEKYTGDVMGGMNKRRDVSSVWIQRMRAQLACMKRQAGALDYAIVLRAKTQARGSFEMEFSARKCSNLRRKSL